MTTQFVSNLSKKITTYANPLILIAGLLTASLSPVFVTTGIAHADINNTRADASGTLELGSSSWLVAAALTYTPTGTAQVTTQAPTALLYLALLAMAVAQQATSFQVTNGNA
jgi:hypothetical protein